MAAFHGFRRPLHRRRARPSTAAADLAAADRDNQDIKPVEDSWWSETEDSWQFLHLEPAAAVPLVCLSSAGSCSPPESPLWSQQCCDVLGWPYAGSCSTPEGDLWTQRCCTVLGWPDDVLKNIVSKSGAYDPTGSGLCQYIRLSTVCPEFAEFLKAHPWSPATGQDVVLSPETFATPEKYARALLWCARHLSPAQLERLRVPLGDRDYYAPAQYRRRTPYGRWRSWVPVPEAPPHALPEAILTVLLQYNLACPVKAKEWEQERGQQELTKLVRDLIYWPCGCWTYHQQLVGLSRWGHVRLHFTGAVYSLVATCCFWAVSWLAADFLPMQGILDTSDLPQCALATTMLALVCYIQYISPVYYEELPTRPTLQVS